MNKATYKTYRKHWTTSDIHFNHKAISLYCPASRGQFVTQTGTDDAGQAVYDHMIDEMNEAIISNWNQVVHPDDHTFILGDVAMGQLIHAAPLIKRLNGAKTLICGNHDQKLITMPDVGDLFIDIRDYLRISACGVGVVMSHYPFVAWDGRSHGSVMLHGHLHSPTHKCHDIARGRVFDVGLDGNNLYPHPFEDLVQQLVAGSPVPQNDHHGRPV